MAHEPSPQTAPATALAQLLTENPQLPPLDWSLSKDGRLHGYISGPGDLSAVFDAYERVLGGGRGAVGFEFRGTRQIGHYLHTTWRDVPLSVDVICDEPDVSTAGQCPDGRAAA